MNECGALRSYSGSGFASQGQQAIAGTLAFWMANASELLNFLKHDNDLSPLTRQSQLDLSHLVHSAYRYADPQKMWLTRARLIQRHWLLTLLAFCSCLVQSLQNALRTHLPTFLLDPEQHGSLPLGIGKVKTVTCLFLSTHSLAQM